MMTKLSYVAVQVLLFVCYVNSTSITDSFDSDGKSCKNEECGSNKSFDPPTPSSTRILFQLLEFLKQQVPMIFPQSRSELEFSAVWLLDETFLNLKNKDFKYMPPVSPGPSTPLLDTSNIFSPSSSNVQNYIVARSIDSRHPPEWTIHKQVTFNRIFNSYKKAKAMLMYSPLHPSKQGALLICNMKAVLDVPVMVVFSISRENIEGTTTNLANCGIEIIQTPPRLPITLFVSTDEVSKRIPDIGYIFYGYNVLYGNPIVDPTEGHDPGISPFPIFKATYDGKRTTSDGRYLVPDGTSFHKAVSCKVDFSSSKGRSEKSYIDSLSVSVGIEGGYLGFEFKASTTVQKKTEETRIASFSYVNTKAVCSVYTGSIFMLLPPKPSDEFIAALKKCDEDRSDDNFRFLINKFGTHFITDVVMGSKFGQESKIETDQYEKMKSEGINVGVAAAYSGSFSAGMSLETDSQKTQRETFESSRTSTTTYSCGSNIPADGDAMTWASQSTDNPMPINMELRSLSELLIKEFLEDSGINYEKLKQPLIDYLTKYCSKLVDEGKAKDCMPPKGT